MTSEHVINYRNPRELVAYGRNARTHSDEQLDGIARSIQKFGFNQPILLKDDDKTIGAGHGRQRAVLRILDDPDTWGPLNTPNGNVPTITLSGLGDAEWRAYVIADNRLSDQGGWDFALLELEVRELQEIDGTLPMFAGFGDAELAALLHTAAPPSLDDLDRTHGNAGEREFWPVIKLQMPPGTKAKFDKLMSTAQGAEDHDKFAALLNAAERATVKAASGDSSEQTDTVGDGDPAVAQVLDKPKRKPRRAKPAK